MKNAIKYRLFLAMLAATGTVVISMFIITQWSIDRGFLKYVNTIEQERLDRLSAELEQTFERKGNWDFLRGNTDRWSSLLAATLPRERLHPEPKAGAGEQQEIHRFTFPKTVPSRISHRFETRVALTDAGRGLVAGPSLPPVDTNFRPLVIRGKTVGYLGLLPRRLLTDTIQLRYVRQQKLAIALIASVMLLVSAGISLPLANHLIRPIKTIAAAIHRLASGKFDTRVTVRSSDELGRLARDVNYLALSLEKNEQMRRQWVADISHELRTPLAVLRGEIEAIQDGVRRTTPEAIRSLHSEVIYLGRLVDDLYQLSLSDAGAMSYRMEELDLAEVLDETLFFFRPEFGQKRIDLQADIPEDAGFTVYADHERLYQLFSNLLDNAMKYTDAPGTLEIHLERSDGRAIIHFRDTSPGVPGGDLERLFDRLYRVESSRSRSSGGAGLGLAICRNIVEAHGGTIEALPSPLGGVWIRISLPLTGAKS